MTWKELIIFSLASENLNFTHLYEFLFYFFFFKKS